MKEKRLNKRFPLSRLSAYDLERERYLRVKPVDISAGGIGFFSKEFIDGRDRIWLSFSFLGEGEKEVHIEAEGQIVGVIDTPDGLRFGIAFSRMDDEDKKTLIANLSMYNDKESVKAHGSVELEDIKNK